jgi:hypothetical protein
VLSYRQIKYTQLNSDVFTGTIAVDWQQMQNEYEHSKKVAGVKESSVYETALTLRHFERLVGRCNSKQITQNAIDKFILNRGNEVKRPTLNKDKAHQFPPAKRHSHRRFSLDAD